jgi:hypothetical protein
MPHKPRQERIDEVLTNLRDRTTTEEESLEAIFKQPHQYHKQFPDARALLGKVRAIFYHVQTEGSIKQLALSGVGLDRAVREVR